MSEVSTLGSYNGTTCWLGAGQGWGPPLEAARGFPIAVPPPPSMPSAEMDLRPSPFAQLRPLCPGTALCRLQALGLLQGLCSLFKTLGELFEIPGHAEGPAESRSDARALT